jgi:signal transduction histidine kinase
MTMKILVDRRERLHIREQREKLIANTAHDLMTPMSGLQLSLSVLRVGAETNKLLSDHETQLIETAENCSTIMARICTSSFAELREDAGPGVLIGRPSAANPETEGKLDELVNCLYKVSTILRRLTRESSSRHALTFACQFSFVRSRLWLPFQRRHC